jgi:2,4-dienoyl-CoA reductase-like NADH-dependent reductase (Old Yellow Enzyme family)
MTSETPAVGARDVAPLFQPMDIGGCRLANRIAMTAMSRNFSPGGVLGDVMIDYYRRRAEGGVGLIITEGVAVTPLGAYTTDVPFLTGDAGLAQWARVVAAVHGAGGKIMPQLWHTGHGRIPAASHLPHEPNIGPSADYPRRMPREEYPGFIDGRAMTQADIDHTIEGYVIAASNAQALGFDGVQIHAAHGYLIDSFFWGLSNQRTDHYNGPDIADRTRFGVEVVQAIRRRVGPCFPIGLRFSQWKLVGHYGSRLVETPAELERFLKPLADAGVDFFDCSTRRYWDPAFEGSDLNLAGWTKKLSGLPSMTVGSIGLNGLFQTTPNEVTTEAKPDANLDRLLEMLERGDFDLVGVGRALLANPAWPNAVREGRYHDLVAYSGAALAKVY